MVAVLGRYASRFSIRAAEVTVDSTLFWVGALLAVVAAVRLAFVPRLPSADSVTGPGLSAGNVRITPGTNRRLRLFAVAQIAASFVLLAGAGMLLTTLISLQRQQTGISGGNVLAVNVPVISLTRKPEEAQRVLQGSAAPHRRTARRGARGARHGGAVARSRVLRRTVHRGGLSTRPTAKRIRGRSSAPSRRGSSTSLGVPVVAGRDFNADDRRTPRRS